MKLSNINVDYHRNGISGEGFHVCAFNMDEDGVKHRMIATVFDGPGQVAVLDVDMLHDGVHEFMKNSWRGDRFEKSLRRAIKKFDNRP